MLRHVAIAALLCSGCNAIFGVDGLVVGDGTGGTLGVGGSEGGQGGGLPVVLIA